MTRQLNHSPQNTAPKIYAATIFQLPVLRARRTLIANPAIPIVPRRNMVKFPDKLGILVLVTSSTTPVVFVLLKGLGNDVGKIFNIAMKFIDNDMNIIRMHALMQNFVKLFSCMVRSSPRIYVYLGLT